MHVSECVCVCVYESMQAKETAVLQKQPHHVLAHTHTFRSFTDIQSSFADVYCSFADAWGSSCCMCLK